MTTTHEPGAVAVGKVNGRHVRLLRSASGWHFVPDDTDLPSGFLEDGLGDAETDGLHPHRKAWEIAMIRRDFDGTEQTCSIFVRINLATADPHGLTIGRFFDRHPDGRKLTGKPPVGPANVWSTHDAAKRVL